MPTTEDMGFQEYPKGVAVAIAAERERCAQTAEQVFNRGIGHPYDQGFIAGCKAAAAAIRKLV